VWAATLAASWERIAQKNAAGLAGRHPLDFARQDAIGDFDLGSCSADDGLDVKLACGCWSARQHRAQLSHRSERNCQPAIPAIRCIKENVR
jgi:hypothetical protein